MSILITPDCNAARNETDDIFLSSAFRRIIAGEFKLTAVQVQLQHNTNQYCFPAFIQSNLFGKKTLILGAGFDKTGAIPVFSSENYQDSIERLIKALANTNISTLEIRTTQRIPCLQDDSDKVEPNIDMPNGAAAVWENLSKKTRSNIRRTLKHGFSAEIGTSENLLDTFYTLYQRNIQQLGSLPHPKTFFAQILKQHPEQSLIFIGYMENKPVVAAFNLVNTTEIYFAWAGRDPDYRQHDPFLTMLWQMVEYCEQNGKKTYNLGRSSFESNPYTFKMKLANRVNKIYYYKLNIPRQSAPSRLRKAVSWLIQRSPTMVMNGFSRALIHKFY